MTSLYLGSEAVATCKAYIGQKKSDKKNIVVLCDKNTEKHCLPLLENHVSFPFADLVISIPSGEEHKNIETVTSVWQKLVETNSDRNTVLISLGGGVVCDLGGFVAATFKRGIESAYIPTSLIAQVDAAIGGKTGFNLGNSKNQIGVFNPPKCVFIIPPFLETLPEREIRSGFMEMLKHGLIADKTYWEKLRSIESSTQIIEPDLIEKSIKIKTDICAKDPFEKNERKKLNFGHTVGHALEALSLEEDQPISHGEAIGMGMIAETHISFQKRLINEQAFASISGTLLRFIDHKAVRAINRDSFMYYLHKDKKKEDRRMNFTLLDSIGNAVINQDVKPEEVISALDFLLGVGNR